MRVLLINTSENIGGAAIAANRLLQALTRNGVEATLLVRDLQEGRAGVTGLPGRLWPRAAFLMERGEVFVRNGFSRHNLFAIDPATRGTDVTRLPEFRSADVIHLHWTNQGMLSLGGLRRILRSGKPVVWTMHDMWPFTGVCHQSGSCEAWLTGCGNCPLLHRPAANDLSAQTYRRKARAYADGHLTLVGCSRWLTGLARRSPLLKGHTVTSIPNPLDTGVYAPGDRDAARRRLGLPADKRIVLFVAYKVTDPNKGIGYLREAIARLCAERPGRRGQIVVAAVGREAEKLCGTFATPVYAKEYVSDTATMIDYYRAADILAMPTLMDNLPNTIAEAMACGTPCVGFDTGGLPQMIDHGTNGLLIPYRDADALARGLESALFDPACADFPQQARDKAVQAYSEQSVAAQYTEIYRDALQHTPPHFP